ncbi:hypothetical protein TRFO_41947 [Tritrichomonas foetus]|uniref:Small GTP-binding protein n=1 Tax=Tritrichomonas foetus TaxID=1144522 RepID=A0A1J4L2V8_9EUKA|nr:hypothetical protein TRFO_41947 [Tritrichomonas foetus]|eukprot:OHT16237.1 hypothetical protein TRFO_41947 [Tritrichomonas foetus]
MFQGRILEYRIAVFGLEGHGKSGVIQRLCANAFSDTPHTEAEQQSTAVWDNSFAYFWEFPPDQINSTTIDSIVIGFGAILFVFDINQIDNEQLEKTRLYLEDLMKSNDISNTPLLLVATKTDCMDSMLLSDIKPTKLMNSLTENLKKTQLIFFSAKEGRGAADVQQWILQRAVTTHVCEAGRTERTQRTQRGQTSQTASRAKL